MKKLETNMILKYLDNYEMDKNEYLTFHSMVFDGYKNFWVYSNRFAACFKIDFETYISSFIGWNEKRETIGYRADVVGTYKEYVINITRDGQYLEIINRTDNHKKYVCILEEEQVEVDRYISFISGEAFFLISKKGNEIFKFSLKEIVEKEIFNREKIVRKKEKSGEEIRRCIGIKNQYLLFIMNDTCSVEVMDILKGTFKTYYLENDGTGIADVVLNQNVACVLYQSGEVVLYDAEKELKIDCLSVPHKVEKNGTYNKCFYVLDYIWVFPATAEHIFKIHIKDRKVEIYENYPLDFEYQFPKAHSKFASFYENKEHIFVGQRNANYMMIINKKTGEDRWIQIKYPLGFLEKEFPPKLMQESTEKRTLINEKFLSLNEYLKAIKINP